MGKSDCCLSNRVNLIKSIHRKKVIERINEILPEIIESSKIDYSPLHDKECVICGVEYNFRKDLNSTVKTCSNPECKKVMKDHALKIYRDSQSSLRSFANPSKKLIILLIDFNILGRINRDTNTFEVDENSLNLLLKFFELSKSRCFEIVFTNYLFNLELKESILDYFKKIKELSSIDIKFLKNYCDTKFTNIKCYLKLNHFLNLFLLDSDVYSTFGKYSKNDLNSRNLLDITTIRNLAKRANNLQKSK